MTMRMNLTITESERERILKLHSINEQPESVMDRRIGAGFDPITGKPRESILSQLSSEDRHTVLQVLSIASFFVPYVGPILSLGFELGDAALYASENDPSGTALALAFALIPFGELIKIVPGIKKIGREGLGILIEKLSKPGSKVTLNQAEREVLEQIVHGGGDQLKRKVTRQVLKKLMQNSLKGMTFKQKLAYIYTLMNKYRRYKVLEYIVTVGSGYYTFKQLFEIFGFMPPVKGDEEKQKEILNTSSNTYQQEKQFEEAGVESLVGQNIDDQFTKENERILSNIKTNQKYR
jgi:hypothetical protein